MALKPLFGYPKHCELSAMEQAYHNARKEHLWFFCKRERTAKGRRYKLKKKSFVGQPPRENFICRGPPPPVGSTPPWDAFGTPLGHLLWHPLWFNSSVEVLGYDATDSTDSQAKVGCVIAVRVSYMFTTFYLMSETR